MVITLYFPLLIVEATDIEDTVPYNEEELAALYPNPQLEANEQFIDYFIKVSDTNLLSSRF